MRMWFVVLFLFAVPQVAQSLSLKAAAPKSAEPVMVAIFPEQSKEQAPPTKVEPATADKPVQPAPLQFIEAPRSDLSGRPLMLGRWYHKKGFHVDITQDEFVKLPRNEQSKYVRVDTQKDLETLLAGDLDHAVRMCEQGAPLEEGELCIRDDHGHQHVSFRSNLSKKPLALGHWYHKMGEDFDISDDEFNSLSPNEQKLYLKVNSLKDLDTKKKDSTVEEKQPAPSTVHELHKAPAVLNSHRFIAYHSDVSGQVLQLGKWYHKLGHNWDINEEEWKKLNDEQKVQFVRIDSSKDLSKLEHEDWIHHQNDLIHAEEQGPIAVLGEKIKQTMSSQAKWFSGQINKFAQQEEDMYKKAKLGMIQNMPTMFEHPGHTFAGVHIAHEDEEIANNDTKETDVVSSAGYAIRVARDNVAPDHVEGNSADNTPASGQLKKQAA